MVSVCRYSLSDTEQGDPLQWPRNSTAQHDYSPALLLAIQSFEPSPRTI